MVFAKNESYTVDGHEISEAMWVEWKPLLQTWRAAGKPEPKDASGKRLKGISPKVSDQINWGGRLPEDKNLLQHSFLMVLNEYEAGRYVSCKFDPSKGKVKFGGI